MSLRSILLKVARAVLNQVLQEITRQLNIVQQQVIEQFQNYLTQVVDGVWKGEDAEQFKVDMQKIVMPNLKQTTDLITRTHAGILQAADVIDRADQSATQLVSDLNSVFTHIY